MSNRSKKNIQYTKPEDPKFLALLKSQIGYQDKSADLEAKRQKIETNLADSDEDTCHEDEKPQIVQLKQGDLTAEEVAQEEKRIELEKSTAPADLSKPIIFQYKRKVQEVNTFDKETKKAKKTNFAKSKSSKSNSKAVRPCSSKLSFNEDDEEEDDE